MIHINLANVCCTACRIFGYIFCLRCIFVGLFFQIQYTLIDIQNTSGCQSSLVGRIVSRLCTWYSIPSIYLTFKFQIHYQNVVQSWIMLQYFITGITINEERSKVVDFTEPFMLSELGIATKVRIGNSAVY